MLKANILSTLIIYIHLIRTIWNNNTYRDRPMLLHFIF